MYNPTLWKQKAELQQSVKILCITLVHDTPIQTENESCGSVHKVSSVSPFSIALFNISLFLLLICSFSLLVTDLNASS